MYIIHIYIHEIYIYIYILHIMCISMWNIYTSHWPVLYAHQPSTGAFLVWYHEDQPSVSRCLMDMADEEPAHMSSYKLDSAPHLNFNMEHENEWNMMVAKRNLLSKGLLFRFHVKLQGCFRCLWLAFQVAVSPKRAMGAKSTAGLGLAVKKQEIQPWNLENAYIFLLKTALSATSIYQLYKSVPLLPSDASQFFPLENASFVGPSVPAFIEMQKATIEASHAALPPKKAGDTRDAITIPSAKGMKERVNNWWQIG